MVWTLVCVSRFIFEMFFPVLGLFPLLQLSGSALRPAPSYFHLGLKVAVVPLVFVSAVHVCQRACLQPLLCGFWTQLGFGFASS